MSGKKHFGDTTLGEGISLALIILALCLGFGGCVHLASAAPISDPILPDSHLTPGVALTNVTVEQICQPGYAKSVRDVPESEKRQVFIEYFGSVPAQPGNYEIDHLISLELGGSNDIRNLWPQSYQTQPWNSHVKDKLEDRMAALVRAELQKHGPSAAETLLRQYQQEISKNWIAAYRQIFNEANNGNEGTP